MKIFAYFHFFISKICILVKNFTSLTEKVAQPTRHTPCHCIRQVTRHCEITQTKQYHFITQYNSHKTHFMTVSILSISNLHLVSIHQIRNKLVVVRDRDRLLVAATQPIRSQVLAVRGRERPDIGHHAGRYQGVTYETLEFEVKQMDRLLPSHLGGGTIQYNIQYNTIYNTIK